MKKMILLLLLAFPVFCFSQTTEKKAKEITETATEIMDALDGINPAEDYIKINDHITKTFETSINKTTLNDYKKNGHFLLFFYSPKKTIFIFYLYKNQIYRRPILLDPTCQECKATGTMTYSELESKALVSLFSEKMKNAVAPFLASLIYHPDFITYMKNNNK